MCTFCWMYSRKNGTGPLRQIFYLAMGGWKSVSVLINDLLLKENTVLENGWVGETSYMHILGQCSLCALCDATAARSLPEYRYRTWE